MGKQSNNFEPSKYNSVFVRRESQFLWQIATNSRVFFSRQNGRCQHVWNFHGFDLTPDVQRVVIRINRIRKFKFRIFLRILRSFAQLYRLLHCSRNEQHVQKEGGRQRYHVRGSLQSSQIHVSILKDSAGGNDPRNKLMEMNRGNPHSHATEKKPPKNPFKKNVQQKFNQCKSNVRQPREQRSTL